MSKFHLCLVLVASAVLLWWKATPGSQSQLFDLKKTQQELEIMKGILQTTLEFAVREVQGAGSSEKMNKWDVFGVPSNISAFYLYGQGAVFTIPTSTLRRSFNFDLKGPMTALVYQPHELKVLTDLEPQVQEEVDRAQEELERAQEEVERAREELEGALEREKNTNSPNPPVLAAPAAPTPPQAAPAPGKPAVSPKPPQPAAPRSGLSLERKEQLRKRLAEAQERVKKRQQQLEADQSKFREQLSEIKVYLIEALANHADSLSSVKPNEYINLIITEDGEPFSFGGEQRNRREVISVQKSVVTDYKAGKINLDGFKQKVLDYSN
jgi:F0F1-type ATP synthase membrane subunit b/b'